MTTALISARREKSDRYARLSRLKLLQARQELAHGDTMQASEKAYGAVTCAAKAYGERRGWNHYSHIRVERILSQLRDEEQEPTLVARYYAVKSLHSNFFEYELEPSVVQDHLDLAAVLTARLEELRQAPPHPLPAASLNPEQRRRLTLLLQPPQADPVPVADLPRRDDLPPLP